LRILVLGFSEGVDEAIRALANMGHEVVLYVDKATEHIRDLQREVDIAVFEGNPLDIDKLREAGIEKADAAIIAHPSDAVSVALCSIAKDFKVKYIMVLVHDKNVAKTISDLALAQRVVSLSELHGSTLVDILVESVWALKRLNLGEYTMYIHRVSGDSRLINVKLGELAEEKWIRSAIVVKPDGSVVTQENKEYTIVEGDTVIIVSKERDIHVVLDRLLSR